MLDVVKKKDLDNTYVVFIKADEGDFVFTFCGNLDLYFSYFGKDLRKEDKHSFTLDINNYFLYKCFDDLYNAIVSEKPFFGHSDNIYRHELYFFPLLKNGVIEWHSDDGSYDEGAVLFIERKNDSYKITIKEGMITDIGQRTASVRFRNSGSLYDPYNWTFMSLYNQLCKHNFENEQVTIEEYINKIKVRKR